MASLDIILMQQKILEYKKKKIVHVYTLVKAVE